MTDNVVNSDGSLHQDPRKQYIRRLKHASGGPCSGSSVPCDLESRSPTVSGSYDNEDSVRSPESTYSFGIMSPLSVPESLGSLRSSFSVLDQVKSPESVTDFGSQPLSVKSEVAGSDLSSNVSSGSRYKDSGFEEDALAERFDIGSLKRSPMSSPDSLGTTSERRGSSSGLSGSGGAPGRALGDVGIGSAARDPGWTSRAGESWRRDDPGFALAVSSGASWSSPQYGPTVQAADSSSRVGFPAGMPPDSAMEPTLDLANRLGVTLQALRSKVKGYDASPPSHSAGLGWGILVQGVGMQRPPRPSGSGGVQGSSSGGMGGRGVGVRYPAGPPDRGDTRGHSSPAALEMMLLQERELWQARQEKCNFAALAQKSPGRGSAAGAGLRRVNSLPLGEEVQGATPERGSPRRRYEQAAAAAPQAEALSLERKPPSLAGEPGALGARRHTVHELFSQPKQDGLMSPRGGGRGSPRLERLDRLDRLEHDLLQAGGRDLQPTLPRGAPHPPPTEPRGYPGGCSPYDLYPQPSSSSSSNNPSAFDGRHVDRGPGLSGPAPPAPPPQPPTPSNTDLTYRPDLYGEAREEDAATRRSRQRSDTTPGDGGPMDPPDQSRDAKPPRALGGSGPSDPGPGPPGPRGPGIPHLHDLQLHCTSPNEADEVGRYVMASADSTERLPHQAARISSSNDVTDHRRQQREGNANETRDGAKSDVTYLCQVCGDISAGFHCGAYVCEACKKFFVRCIKQESGIKVSCPRKRACEITKETRTQCQYCRFQKCLVLGMYRPGGANISSEICHIPCKVCGAPSSGYHFGAITCEGCKGFFRRTIRERDHMKYRCTKNNNCMITTSTRNICKHCRYQKCLDVGMKPDGSRIGRQPNSIKHATLIELQTIKTIKGLPPDPAFPMPLMPQFTIKQDNSSDEGYGRMPSPPQSPSGRGRSEAEDQALQAAVMAVESWAPRGEKFARVFGETRRLRLNDGGGGGGAGGSGSASGQMAPPADPLDGAGFLSLNDLEGRSGPGNNTNNPAFLDDLDLDCGLPPVDRGVREIQDLRLWTPESRPVTSSPRIAGGGGAAGDVTKPASLGDGGDNRRDTAALGHGVGHLTGVSGQSSFNIQGQPAGPDLHTGTGYTPFYGNNHQLSQSQIRSHSHSQSQIYSHSPSQSQIHSHSQSQIHSHSPSQSQIHSHSPSQSQIHSQNPSHRSHHGRHGPTYIHSSSHLSASQQELRLGPSSHSRHCPEALHEGTVHEPWRTPVEKSPPPPETPSTPQTPPTPQTQAQAQAPVPPPGSPADLSKRRMPSNKRAAENDLSNKKPAMVYDVKDTVRIITTAFKELYPIRQKSWEGTRCLDDNMSRHDVWIFMMEQFTSSAHAVLKFAKKVPGFRTLPMEEQIQLIQATMFPIVLTLLSMDYDLTTCNYNYFNYCKLDEAIILSNFPSFTHLLPSFHRLGAMVASKRLREVDIGLLCALFLVTTASKEELYRNILTALKEDSVEHLAESETHLDDVKASLDMLQKANEAHQKAMMAILTNPQEYEGIEFPQLFQETYVSDTVVT